ncbi:MAG TPA: cellulase family glycosylhydrolase [Solirubrobacteraceae bacterium]
MRYRLIIIALLSLLTVPVAAQASPRQSMSFEAPSELLDYSRVDATLTEIKAFGVSQIRQLVYWQSFAPRPRSKKKPKFNAANPDAYPAGTWSRLDGLMASAKAHGIEVMLTPTGPVPKWATSTKKDSVTRPSARAFGQFVTALARRYGDQVQMWSIWNEPNQPQFLLPQYRKKKPYSPTLYRGLYRAAYNAIRSVAANKRDKILIGETSPRGNVHVVHPLTFLRGIACLNARYHRTKKCSRLPADGYAHHAYTTRTGPRFIPPDKNDVTIGVISRLVKALDRVGRAGGLPKRLKIYLTEFGIQSYPDKISGVPFDRQPAYYAIAEHIAYVNSRVAMFSQYLMRDDLPRSSGYRYRGFESGLRRSNGKAKPAYKAFANPLAVERSRNHDVLWGRIRPETAPTKVTIQIRRKGKKSWSTVRTVTTTSRGVFGLSTSHRNGSRYRVRWTGADKRRHTGPAISAY